MATRPVLDDLVSWLGLTVSPQPDTADGMVLNDVLAAALEEIESRLRSDAIPTDANSYPSRIRLAVLMQAARWAKRRNSPEGVAGFGDLGAIRVTDIDPDIVRLIQRFLRLDGFA